jgi:hypothetical protein
MLHASSLTRQLREVVENPIAADDFGFELTKTCLWLISLGVFDREYARAAVGSMPQHNACRA